MLIAKSWQMLSDASTACLCGLAVNNAGNVKISSGFAAVMPALLGLTNQTY
jgi:hypothetical protein